MTAWWQWLVLVAVFALALAAMAWGWLLALLGLLTLEDRARRRS